MSIEQITQEKQQLAALVVRLKEALSREQQLHDMIDREFPASVHFVRYIIAKKEVAEALSLVPSDLAECCVVKRSEWDRINLFINKNGLTLEATVGIREANAALEAENRALRKALKEAVALLERTPFADHHPQCPLTVDSPIGSKGCVCVDELAPFRKSLAPKEGK